LSTEDACVAENCAAKAASGSGLMQKVLTETRESGFAEDDIADAAVDVDTADNDKQRGPKPLKFCDKWPKKKVQRKVDSIKKRIPGFEKKCEGRVAARIERLKKAIEHFEKCIGKYGSFVEDRVSEMAEDGADEPETLDKLVETGAEEFEFLEDLDEAEEDAETEDAETEDAETEDAEIEDVDESELIDADKPKPLPTCDKISKGTAEKIIAGLKKKLPSISKEMCKKKKDFLNKTLEHYTKCL